MSQIRLAYGSLHHHGAGLMPDDLEGVDYLLLDGGPIVAPEQVGPEVFLDAAFQKLAPSLYLQPELKVLVTLAGRRPEDQLWEVGERLIETGNGESPIGVVHGGDALDRLEEFLAAGERLEHNETRAGFSIPLEPCVATLTLGQEPIRSAFGQGARLVLIGHAEPRDAVAGIVPNDPEDSRSAAAAAAAEALSSNAAGFPGDLDRKDLSIRPGAVVDLSSAGGLRGRAGEPIEPATPPVSSSPPDRTPLTLVMMSGAVATTLLADAGVDAEENLRRSLALWRAGLEAEGLPTAPAEAEWLRPVDDSGRFVVLIKYRHDDPRTANAGLRRLRQQCALWPSGPQIDAASPQRFVNEYSVWPTTVSTNLVEWSVDIRPAKDWLE